MKTCNSSEARPWINNVRVSLTQAPLLIRIDFSLGPFYERGDTVRLVDLDPTAGHVLGKVIDVFKDPDTGLFAKVEWSLTDLIPWDPKEQ